MSDLDNRLTAALHADAPTARDAIFRVEVLARLERARFRRRVARTMLVAAVVAVVVAMNAPAIDVWMAGDLQRLFIVVVGVAVALLALPGLLTEAPSGVRTIVNAFGRWLYP